MKFELVVYDALPCAAKVFTVNDIKADLDDFGVVYDDRSSCDRAQYDEDAWEWGCMNMGYCAFEPNDAILEKYGLTIKEYYDLEHILENTFNIGECGWCV